MTGVTPDSPATCLWPEEKYPRGSVESQALAWARRNDLTVAGLCAMTEWEVLDLRGAGPATARELRRVLAGAGLALSDGSGPSPAEARRRAGLLAAAGIRPSAALRFARQSWPEGEIAPGIRIEVAE